MATVKTLTLDEVARLLHVARGTLLNWLREDKNGIRSIAHKTGKQWLFLENEVLEWIRSQPEKK